MPFQDEFVPDDEIAADDVIDETELDDEDDSDDEDDGELHFSLRFKERKVTIELENGEKKKCIIRELQGQERDEYTNLLLRRTQGRKRDIKGLSAELIHKCLFEVLEGTEPGNRKLRPFKKEVIEKWPSSVREGLLKACNKLTGFETQKKSDEDDEKNE